MIHGYDYFLHPFPFIYSNLSVIVSIKIKAVYSLIHRLALVYLVYLSLDTLYYSIQIIYNHRTSPSMHHPSSLLISSLDLQHLLHQTLHLLRQPLHSSSMSTLLSLSQRHWRLLLLLLQLYLNPLPRQRQILM